MADFSKEDLKQAFIEALQSSGRTVNSKDVDKMVANLSKLDKQIAAGTPSLGGLFKSIITGKKAVTDLTSELKNLEEKIDELSDSADESAIAQRQELIQRKTAIQRLNEQNVAHKAAIDGVTAFGKAVSGIAGVAGRTMGGLVRGIQDGSSAFSLAGGVMAGAIDGVNVGVQAAAGGMGAIGTTMMTSTNPRLKMLGAAATVAGTALGMFGNIMASSGKVVVELMVKEMEKTIKSYETLSNAGALFAGGMTDMRNSAWAANLSMKQFGEVVSKNSEAFAQSGLGVTEGARQMGRVSKVLEKTGIQDQLLKLGYGFQEQAELIAETTANMRRSAGGKFTDNEIATQTAKYAENLKIIAAITGEDAKKKVQQVQAENQILAFQQIMAGKTAEQRAQIDAAMATMSEQERKNLRDRAVFGSVVNEEGAIYESLVAGAREKGQAQLALLNSNQLTAESNASLNVEYGKVMKESIESQRGVAAAGYALGGATASVSKAMLESLNQINTYTEDSKKATKEAIEGQKKAADDLTKGYVEAAKAAQKLAIDLETIVGAQLGKFAGYSALIIDELRKQLGALKGIDTSGQPSLWDDIVKNALDLGQFGGTVGLGVGAVAGGLPGAVAGSGTGMVVGGGIGVAKGIYEHYTRPKAKASEDKKLQSGQITDNLREILANPVLAGLGQPTSLNDSKHATNSAHYQGRGADFSIKHLSNDEIAKLVTAVNAIPGVKKAVAEDQPGSARLAKIKEAGGLTLENSGATGLHMHLEALAKGGITHGPSLAGEAGPEAVIPLPDGRTIPVKMDGIGELIEKFDEMIRILKDQLDVSEKHLRADT